MLKLEILDAHLHVLQSLATATKDVYSLDLDNRKLSLMLWSLNNELSSTLENIRENNRKTNDSQAAEESNHD